jgi:hypothetical protein
MHTKSSLLGGVAFGVLLAVSIGASAEAATAKKKHMVHHPVVNRTQKEIDELRQQVQFLKDRLDEQASLNAQSQAQLQQAQATAASAQQQAVASAQSAQAAQAQIIQTIPTQINTAIAANKPKTDKLYYKGVTVTLGGFAEAASIYRSRDETADISSSFSKIPFANDPAARSPELRGTARQSRVQALVQGDISPTTHAIFYGEFDFQGAAQTANSNQSDSYNPRIRNVYGEMDWDKSGWHVLAGQNWSLVTLNNKGITPRNELIPPEIDAQYIPGFAWARQPQIRVTKDFMDHQLWVAVSAENPQTTFGNVTAASGAAITDNQSPTNGYFAASGAATTYSLNKYPDLVAKVAYESKFMDRTVHLEAFALGRSFYDRVLLTAPTAASAAAGINVGNNDHTTYGGGVGVGVVANLFPKLLDFQGSFLSGSGIGRYGSGGLPDVTSTANGALKAIPENMWLAGLTLHPVSQVDVYVFGGGEYEGQATQSISGVSSLFGYGNGVTASNAGCYVINGSCSPLTKSLNQITSGFWDRIYQGSFGRVQVGLQYSYTLRDTFADTAGRAPKAYDNMIFTSFRYYPF